MSTLKKELYFMPAASMGKNNPIPNIISNEDQHSKAKIDRNTVSEEEGKYMGWGKVKSIYPYTMQDGYNRRKKERGFESYVLENAHLKARFIPGFGGRLWSLYDKDNKRELLHKNPVFQPCNLALRNAWISGGVEWNVGIIGHTPFTIDSMFVRTKTLKDGTPVLSFYQYERIRRILYRVEAFLPENSKQLFVRVRIDNPLDEESKVYWWSNMAVDEDKENRIIVNAKRAFNFDGESVKKVSIPKFLNRDLSYAECLPHSMDFFFDIEKSDRKFIASLDKEGYGLVQTSTDTLQGRKLFVWGKGRGGRNWQTYLSQEGSKYVEIQAGLAKTQFEHLPLMPRQKISWLEAYGALKLDKSSAHVENYQKAVSAANEALNKALDRAYLDDLHDKVSLELDDGAAWKSESLSDGWAYVESLVEKGFDNCGLYFPNKQLKDAAPWVKLLNEGRLTQIDIEKISYQTGDKWIELLEKSLKKEQDSYSLYQLAVMLSAKGDTERARQIFGLSLQKQENPLSYCCLARLDEKEGDLQNAVKNIKHAMSLIQNRHIYLEGLRLLNKAQKFNDTIALYDSLPAQIKALGRAKVRLIEALLEEGELLRAEKLLLKPFVIADIREGEFSLSELWYSLQDKKKEKYLKRALSEKEKQAIRKVAPPVHLDFRTKANEEENDDNA